MSSEHPYLSQPLPENSASGEVNRERYHLPLPTPREGEVVGSGTDLTHSQKERSGTGEVPKWDAGLKKRHQQRLARAQRH